MAQAGTTDDTFLRSNIEWLKRSTDWAKLSATAALGVIHRRHHNNAKAILAPYLPGANNGDYHAEGGALYALGLISPGTCREYDYYNTLFASGNANEPFLHGLCMGAGLMFMGSNDKEMYSKIRDILFSVSCVTIHYVIIRTQVTLEKQQDWQWEQLCWVVLMMK